MKALIYRIEEVLSVAVEAKTSEIMLEFFSNSRNVNTHALFWCIQSLQKAMTRVEKAIEDLHTDDTDSHRKELLTASALFSRYVSQALKLLILIDVFGN